MTIRCSSSKSSQHIQNKKKDTKMLPQPNLRIHKEELQSENYRAHNRNSKRKSTQKGQTIERKITALKSIVVVRSKRTIIVKHSAQDKEKEHYKLHLFLSLKTLSLSKNTLSLSLSLKFSLYKLSL